MKYFLLFMVTLPTLAFSQAITKKLKAQTFGKVEASYTMSVSEEKDTSFYAAIAYKNLQYQYIIDVAVIMFGSKEDCDSFANDLLIMIPLAGETDGLAERKGEGYKIACGSNANVFIYDPDDKRTFISKANATKLANWLKTLPFTP